MGADVPTSLKALLADTITGFDPNAPLWKQLNSIQLVEFVTKLESHFKIQVHAVEFDEENFRTLESLTAFVERKLSGSPRSN